MKEKKTVSLGKQSEISVNIWFCLRQFLQHLSKRLLEGSKMNTECSHYVSNAFFPPGSLCTIELGSGL